MIKNLENEKFDELVKTGIVLVDFYATWCGPCKMLAPVLEEIASDRAEVTIIKVDVDKHNELAKKYGIMSVPTTLYYNNGTLVSKEVGYMPKQAIMNKINNL